MGVGCFERFYKFLCEKLMAKHRVKIGLILNTRAVILGFSLLCLSFASVIKFIWIVDLKNKVLFYTLRCLCPVVFLEKKKVELSVSATWFQYIGFFKCSFTDELCGSWNPRVMDVERSEYITWSDEWLCFFKRPSMLCRNQEIVNLYTICW